MQAKTPATEFLPADRLERETILKLAGKISRSPSAETLALIPLAVAILNDTRQIVHANERFLAMTGDTTLDALLGKRLGEALGCIHANETEGGCGTTRFCRYCGAARAIVKSLEGERNTQECSISRFGMSMHDALNLQVWTVPMDVEGSRFVLNSILDIAHEKTLRGFERLFFHDILNAVSGIKGLHELISLELPAGQAGDLDLLRQAIENIEDLVETQKDFLAVEAREYHRSETALDSREFVGILAAYCQSFNPGQAKTLTVDPEAASVAFSSDGRIIHRILVNMVKNALEASGPGDVVTIGCDASPDAVTFWVRNPAVLSEEASLRIFQKGFSTKGTGRGFGTYGMRLFARECLGGDVDFESSPETGTRFFLRIPN